MTLSNFIRLKFILPKLMRPKFIQQKFNLLSQIVFSALAVSALAVSALAVSALVFSPIATAEPITVVDFKGREVSLNAPAERIVTLAPHIVENVFAIGQGHRIVGTVEYSDYPEAAKKIPRIGGYVSAGVESIIAQNPDLVIAWGTGNKNSTINKLIDLGYTVYIDEPHTIDDIAKSFRDIARLTGHAELGEREAKHLREKHAYLREKYATQKTLSVFYEVWNEPLQSINGKHLISDVIRLCGGKNIYGNAPSLAPLIGLESILERNPDVIIASGMGEERPEWLDEWKKYPELKAVKNSHLFYIPPDLLQRHTGRILDGAELMCSQLSRVRMAALKE
ncbi:MAG: iron complex transport system substrate-binding protein [Flavobacteriales bacterium]|jgi:iron complex transport system substrate-binding protein